MKNAAVIEIPRFDDTRRSVRTEERQRFTVDGSVELEDHLERLCARVRLAIENVVPASKLEGILLGGGYGRGEGGVLRTARGDRPYNDLEFYVFLKGPALLSERKFQSALSDASHELSREAELEIELRAASLRKLRKSLPDMFFYDLVMGHRWILGDEFLLRGCEHHREASRIPMSAATRLLLNRCSGLLFARQRLLRAAFAADDADFVSRNIAKAKLALGDVVLTVRGEYHWSCRERNRLLQHSKCDASWFSEVLKAHSEGAEFKLRPEKSALSRDDLAAMHAVISNLAHQVWLWLESRRLPAEFRSVEEYALSPINKCPEKSAWRNACINLRTFGTAAVGRKLLRYPRERLLNALPLLLWREDSVQVSSPAFLQFIQRELRTEAQGFDSLVESYRALWSRFN